MRKNYSTKPTSYMDNILITLYYLSLHKNRSLLVHATALVLHESGALLNSAHCCAVHPPTVTLKRASSPKKDPSFSLLPVAVIQIYVLYNEGVGRFALRKMLKETPARKELLLKLNQLLFCFSFY